MATLFRVDGTSEIVKPANGKSFTLDELYSIIGCQCIEVVTMRTGPHRRQTLVLDEEGKICAGGPKPFNPDATWLCHEGQAIMPTDWIAGNALLCSGKELR